VGLLLQGLVHASGHDASCLAGMLRRKFVTSDEEEEEGEEE
jgi:hypothetical protein